MEEKELIKLTPEQLTDMGICPTCLDRKYNGAIFGDYTNRRIYSDKDIDCSFVFKPRAEGHMVIITQQHFQDMSEAPDYINEKIIRYARQFMKIIKEVYKCERVYLSTMCDGPVNHYHVQLLPRYSYERRGAKNFIKPTQDYVFQKEKFEKIKNFIYEYSKKDL